MASAQIMIVEDEGITAQDIRRRLLRLGYDIPAMARSGEEAIAKAGECHPDLVLMDIRLQGKMDGIDAADEIRNRYDVPIAYLTAYADDNTLARARQTAPIGYVLKPFREQELHA